MTELQKRCQELLPVIQAGAEGKAIQRQLGGEWRELGTLECFSENFMADCKYRIKPEPQYRPFTPEEAAHLLNCGAWIRGGDGCSYSVSAIELHCVRLSGTREVVSYEHLLERFKNPNGSPCGVKVSD